MPDRPLAVFDVDGVLADVRHRLHHIEGRPRDWAAFFAAAAADPPLSPGLELARECAAECEVVYLTGRPERLRAVTRGWLDREGAPDGRLFMRADRDRRPARLVKAAALQRLAEGREVRTVVDDDPEVIGVLLAAGWPARLADWVVRPASLEQAQERRGRT